MSLTPDSFQRVADLVRRESAIVLEAGKEYLVEARLQPLARDAGCADVDTYVRRVLAVGGATSTRAATDAVVEALTTNETSWFRDREPFEVLASTVVPELLRTRRTHRRISIWSAACSSGQEAYTLAMLMAEHVVPLGFGVDILATDISHAMLDRTREGRYSQLEVGRGLPASLMVRHFERAGTHWQVSDQLRSMVRVQHLNLASAFPVLPRFDVVFLRNVLIYFDAATKAQVLGRVRRTMAPDGFLFLGGAETTLGVDETWARTAIGRCTVNRPHEPTPHEAAPPAALRPAVPDLTGPHLATRPPVAPLAPWAEESVR